MATTQARGGAALPALRGPHMPTLSQCSGDGQCRSCSPTPTPTLIPLLLPLPLPVPLPVYPYPCAYPPPVHEYVVKRSARRIHKRSARKIHKRSARRIHVTAMVA